MHDAEPFRSPIVTETGNSNHVNMYILTWNHNGEVSYSSYSYTSYFFITLINAFAIVLFSFVLLLHCGQLEILITFLQLQEK